MATQQTGVFYAQNLVPADVGVFPRDLRSRLFSHAEPRFLGLFGGSFLVIGVTVFSLSYIEPSETVSDKQILKIQERYASIVLNQPKAQPKVDKEGEGEGGRDRADRGAAEARKDGEEEQKVDRAKETFQERTQRREDTRAARAARRAEVGNQIRSSGIFAAITAAGGSGAAGVSGSPINDLLGGVAGGVGDIANVNISKGTFAASNVDPATLGKGGGGGGPRGGERRTGVDIQRESLGKAEGTQIAAAGNVNLTTKPPEITDEAGGAVASNSRSCIQSVVNREVSRLKRVFENWLKRDPSLGGLLEVKFTILPSGEVGATAVFKSTTNNPSFDENILRYVKRWDFSGCGITANLEIIYPFAFEGQK